MQHGKRGLGITRLNRVMGSVWLPLALLGKILDLGMPDSVSRISLFALLSFLVLPLALKAQPVAHLSLRGHYYVVVWGYQGANNDVVQSHTFASFYKGDDISKGVIKPATISWLPASGFVEPFSSVRGRNFTLGQTLQMACRSGREVKSWGPYEIEPALYQRALKRVRLLNSGRVLYSMIDGPGTMNCIDAAGNFTPTPLDTGIAWGFVASNAVVQHLSHYFIGGGTKVTALAKMLVPRACSRP
jgi:hypothetical protein